MSLTDHEVNRQIAHMMTFIYQEANEKVQEIDAKAEEEFNIDKGRLVQQQRLKIMEFYEKKEKQVEMQKRIQFSKMLYQKRLNVLKVQDDLVNQVLAETRERLGNITDDKESYSELIQKLILQGVYQVFETPVILRIREKDKSLIEALIPKVEETYHETTKRTIDVKIDTENYLAESVSGGVEIYMLDGRIKINNTLETRFQNLCGQLIPQIRFALFGSNSNRKH